MSRKRRFRRLWYFKRRNIKYYRLMLCITTVLLIFILMWVYIFNKLFPVGISDYEGRLYEVTQEVVENKLDEDNITTDGLNSVLDVQKDLEGKIISIKADNIKLNQLSSSIEKSLRDSLIYSQGVQYTAIKASIVPFLNTKIVLGGARINDVETTFVSKFIREGSENTKLKVYLDVDIKYEYLLGTKNKTFEFTVFDVFLGQH